jgi:ACR3 family arsenite transporter
MIGASNFFELSVAVAIALFGADSPVVLATIVGVLVEVPIMLHLVKIANRTTRWFPIANCCRWRGAIDIGKPIEYCTWKTS